MLPRMHRWWPCCLALQSQLQLHHDCCIAVPKNSLATITLYLSKSSIVLRMHRTAARAQ
jgi:hypothetical protein